MWVLTQATLFGNCFLGDSIPTCVLILFVQTQLWHQLSAMGFCPSWMALTKATEQVRAKYCFLLPAHFPLYTYTHTQLVGYYVPV